MNDKVFEIEKGVLKKCNCPEGTTTVAIPEGVVSVGESAFWGCIDLESVTIPGSVISIGDKAFYGCWNLKNVLFSKGLKEIGYAAFQYCKIENIIIPDGVEYIYGGAFFHCAKLKSITIPKSVKYIGPISVECENLVRIEVAQENETYDSRDNCNAIIETKKKRLIAVSNKTVIPVGINDIANGCLNRGERAMVKYEEGYFQTDKKFKGIFPELLNKKWIKKISIVDWTYLYLFQTDKTIKTILKNNPKKANSIVETMLEIIPQYENKKRVLQSHIIEYIYDYIMEISSTNIQKMYEYFASIQWNDVSNVLNAFIEKSKTEATDPYVSWRKEYNEILLDKYIASMWVITSLFEKVRFADSNEYAPAYIVKCAIVPYMQLFTGRPRKIGEYKRDFLNVNIIKKADEAAALLNMDDVREMLEQQVFVKGNEAWLLPYGRYATGNQITSLISDMNKWKSWNRYGYNGRQDIIIARSALMLSDTKEAIINIDKAGILKEYAKLRGTSANVIRDTVLSEFGLDETGKKEYDLGSKKVVVSLMQDLSLAIYDMAENKYVKSIPKKGTDAELVQLALEDIKDIKKNMKKVVKGRTDLLYQNFLAGTTYRTSDWLASYTKNLLLRRMAELIVWRQGKSTFTLTENGAINCDGEKYKIKEAPQIGIAHPLEMKKEKIEAWQKYFTSNGIKQPFVQIWEPVIDEATIKKDRYVGCEIPYYRFRNQEKHGIFVQDFGYHNEICISFEECTSDVERLDWSRHKINNEDTFEVKYIDFKKYTKKVNHIIAYLDKCAAYAKLVKDDATIINYLADFTIAQIMELIQYATENQCNECLAALMDYKNKNFSEYDLMEEFTLD